MDNPCTSPTGLSGYWNDSSFRLLSASQRGLQSVRIPVTYDAVSTWNGSNGCTLSNPYRYAYTDQGGRVHAASESWYDLLYGLQAAYAEGLQPLIVIDGYTTASAVKSYVGTLAAGAAGEPDPTTTAGYWDYYCGVRGILNGIAAHLPSYEWPHQWEAWNEPNGGCTYLNNGCSATAACASVNEPASNYDAVLHQYTCSATGQGYSSCAIGAADAGSAKAGCLWILARNAIVQTSGHAGDVIAAGSFSWPSTGYLNSYVAVLASQGYYPPVYSVHDYADPTASGWLGAPVSEQLTAFDNELGRVTAAAGGAASQLWVTESGVLLTDRDSRYGRFDAIPCPARSAAAKPATLGACLDGNQAAQAIGAQAFFNLQFVTGGPPVTALYWYQWRGAPGWDSGLLDATGNGRAAYCIWRNDPVASCTGNPQATG